MDYYSDYRANILVKSQWVRMGSRSKVSIDEMLVWLRRFELGDPVEKIAKDIKRDVHAVLKYLAQARKEADLRTARQNLLTKALIMHNDDMLKLIINIIQTLEVPNSQVVTRQDEQGNWQDIPLTALKCIHPKVVQERLGHASIKVTLDTYSHVTPGIQQAAANRFDEILLVTKDRGK